MPLTLLIGWHPGDVLLWFLVVEAIVGFVGYWVRWHTQTHNPEMHDKCKRSHIVAVLGALLMMADASASIGMGILLNQHSVADGGGHSLVLLIVAAIS